MKTLLQSVVLAIIVPSAWAHNAVVEWIQEIPPTVQRIEPAVGRNAVCFYADKAIWRLADGKLTKVVEEGDPALNGGTIFLNMARFACEENRTTFAVFSTRWYSTFNDPNARIPYISVYAKEGGTINQSVQVGGPLAYPTADGTLTTGRFFTLINLSMQAGKVIMHAFVRPDVSTSGVRWAYGKVYEVNGRKATLILDTSNILDSVMGMATHQKHYIAASVGTTSPSPTRTYYRVGVNRDLIPLISGVKPCTHEGLTSSGSVAAACYTNGSGLTISLFWDSGARDDMALGQSVAGYPLGEVSHFQVASDGAVLFVMKTGNNTNDWGLFLAQKDQPVRLVKMFYELPSGKPLALMESSGRFLLVQEEVSGVPKAYWVGVPRITTPNLTALTALVGSPVTIGCADCANAQILLGGKAVQVQATPGTGGYTFAVPNTLGKVDYELAVGTARVPFTVTVTPLPRPTISSFAASKRDVAPGENFTLVWDVSGATDVVIDGGIGAVSLKGERTLSLTRDTTFTLTARGAGGVSTSQVTITVTDPDWVPRIAGIANAASGEQSFAPGMLASIYGAGLASETAIAAETPLPTTIAGTQVLVNGKPAALQFVSRGQINFQLPWDVSGSVSINVVRTVGSRQFGTMPWTITVEVSAAGIFRHEGRGIFTDSAYRLAGGPDNPLIPDEIYTAWGTGLGRTDCSLQNGEPSPPGILCKALLPIELKVGNDRAEVFFSGLAPGFPGLYQINFRMPGTPLEGEMKTVSVYLTLTSGGRSVEVQAQQSQAAQ